MMIIVSYLKIARPDHWFKNIFMVPGLLYASVINDFFSIDSIFKFLIALISTCLIASANYVINEWLDSEFDKFHPIKKDRPSVSGNLNYKFVYLEYFVLSTIGLIIASRLGNVFLIISIWFLLMGLIYNVKPLRTKDLPYLDVLTESVNNPIRFLLGWFSVIEVDHVIPISIIIGYWMAGAFLMGIKRFAEYRSIGKSSAELYRLSFKYYNERKLLFSSLFYSMASTFFLGIFLIKHRLELILFFPFLCLLFIWYLSIGFEKDSIVQTPEKLYTNKSFLVYSFFMLILLIFLAYIDIPIVYELFPLD